MPKKNRSRATGKGLRTDGSGYIDEMGIPREGREWDPEHPEMWMDAEAPVFDEPDEDPEAHLPRDPEERRRRHYATSRSGEKRTNRS